MQWPNWSPYAHFAVCAEVATTAMRTIRGKTKLLLISEPLWLQSLRLTATNLLRIKKDVNKRFQILQRSNVYCAYRYIWKLIMANGC